MSESETSTSTKSSNIDEEPGPTMTLKRTVCPDDECSICIEQLVNCDDDSSMQESIARILPCRHCYHELCIRSWSEQANSCPKCRSKFNKVELIDVDGNKFYDYTVEDKDYPVDPNYLAPTMASELDAQDLVDELGPSHICSLCSSDISLYDNSFCVSCGGSFHTNCLGISPTFTGTWHCPNCDCRQERSIMSTMIASSRVARQRSRGTRRNRQSRLTSDTYVRLVRNHRRQHGNRSTHISTSLSASTSASTSAMTSNSSSSSPSTEPRASIGANHIEEEAKAWSQFEHLRKKHAPRDASSAAAAAMAAASDFSSTRAPGGSSEVRKLKRPSRRGKLGIKVGKTDRVAKEDKAAPQLSKNCGSSRVMSLISEMHNNSETLLKNSTRPGHRAQKSSIELVSPMSPPMSPDTDVNVQKEKGNVL